MAPPFIPGVELAGLFYADVVRPLLDQEFPALVHSAALIGPGSEVLGFDAPRSTDHNWGPRLQIFVADAATPGETGRVSRMLAARLPATFRGYPTVFAASGAPADRPPSHWITVTGLRRWLIGQLGFDATGPVGLLDWLAAPAQALAEVTGGAVFHDGLSASDDAAGESDDAAGESDDAAGEGGSEAGAISAVRRRLAWYPRDVWLHVLACQWQRIAEEEPFAGRCAEAGDELGSTVVAARLVRDLMRLALLMERQYPPYSKWLGSALARTTAGAELLPALTAAIRAPTWPEREDHLTAAYETTARLHNALGLTPPLDPAIRPTFYERPYRVLDSGRFVAALRDAICDDRVRALPLTGAIDQYVDSTTAAGDLALLRAATAAQLSGM
jgi:hypothetical protein